MFKSVQVQFAPAHVRLHMAHMFQIAQKKNPEISLKDAPNLKKNRPLMSIFSFNS